MPSFDVKDFSRPDGRIAAVVGIEPIPVPPCITATGVVYQRVTGQTLPVTDERVLAELYGRGRAAREQAELLALRAADRALSEPAIGSPDEAQLSVALCPVRGAGDKAAVIFTRGFSNRFTELVYTRLQVEPMMPYGCQFELRQDCIKVWPSSTEWGNSWCAAAYWDGSVSAVYATSSDELYIDELIGRVHVAWKVLTTIALTAGGSGDAHLVVRIRRDHPAIAVHQRGYPTQPVRRWTDLSEPGQAELDRVDRELQRGFGRASWEPESR